MKYSHPSGALLECHGCSPELHEELEVRLSKLGYSEVMEAPAEAPAPTKKAPAKKKSPAKKK